MTHTDETIRRALMFRSRGLTFREISERLGETMADPPRWEVIRNWCNGDSAQARRVQSAWALERHLKQSERRRA